MYYVARGTGITPSYSREVREREKLEERLQKMTTLMKDNHRTLERLKSDLMDHRNNLLNKLRSEISAKARTTGAVPAKKPKVEEKQEEKHDSQIHIPPKFENKPKEEKPAVQIQIPVPKIPIEDPIIPIVITACNRPAVSRCLDKLFAVRGNKVKQFPVMVSQDCGDQATADVLRGYGDKITYVKHDPEPVPRGVKSHFVGYYKIASHYKFALNQAFSHFPEADSVIILEDDIEVAPDFLSYFVAMHELLKKDDTLWCASAWNDNGLSNLVDGSEKGAELLYRSDFFPGLGWLLKRSLWEEELSKKWPEAFWDDWMRDPAQRKGRACIRPEVSRTSTFGRKGVSGGQFFDSHLKFIKLNEYSVDWASKDLSYLIKDNYDRAIKEKVYGAPLFRISDLKENKDPHEREVCIEYTMAHTFKAFAKELGLMTDFKAGVPRTAYRGIVTTLYRGRRVYLAPPANWLGYNEKWS